jgi:hypothetical protein
MATTCANDTGDKSVTDKVLKFCTAFLHEKFFLTGVDGHIVLALFYIKKIKTV